LLIGDVSTSTGSEIFADAEIDYFAGGYGNAHLAASAAVASLIGSDRGQTLAGVVSKQVGDLKLDYGSGMSISEILGSKSKALRMIGVRKVGPYVGGISVADKDANQDDTDWAQGFARVGQFDHETVAT
jgi:hypothetical protein